MIYHNTVFLSYINFCISTFLPDFAQTCTQRDTQTHGQTPVKLDLGSLSIAGAMYAITVRMRTSKSTEVLQQ